MTAEPSTGRPAASPWPDTLVEVWVPQRPRTKGSLRHLGHGVMREQVSGSSRWRAGAAEVLARARGAVPAPGGLVGGLGAVTGPVAVTLGVYLPRPRSGRAEPICRTDGDLDKFQRNVGDALTDSGWIGDDSQIIAWFAWKAWADGAVGALIRLGAF